MYDGGSWMSRQAPSWLFLPPSPPLLLCRYFLCPFLHHYFSATPPPLLSNSPLAPASVSPLASLCLCVPHFCYGFPAAKSPHAPLSFSFVPHFPPNALLLNPPALCCPFPPNSQQSAGPRAPRSVRQLVQCTFTCSTHFLSEWLCYKN